MVFIQNSLSSSKLGKTLATSFRNSIKYLIEAKKEKWWTKLTLLMPKTDKVDFFFHNTTISSCTKNVF